MMLRLIVVAAAAVALAGPATAIWNPFTAGEVQNKFIVTYNMVPDPMEWFGFYDMPRTETEAKKDKFSKVLTRDEDKTTVWCRKNDYRVCVLFDQKGSVAGVQMSVKNAELVKAKTPTVLYTGIPELRRQTFLDQDVHSATTFFVSKDVLLAGGRTLDKDTLTAPDGIYILQTDEKGVETARLHVGTEESTALSAGFTEQACFFGMGKHYFMDLKKENTCDKHRPYFLLYGPSTKKLNGYGYTMYGKTSQGRGWFESPPALVAKKIAPNSPDCMKDYINKYGMFTMHVYFVERPWLIWC